jgi:hypothetical protein
LGQAVTYSTQLARRQPEELIIGSLIRCRVLQTRSNISQRMRIYEKVVKAKSAVGCSSCGFLDVALRWIACYT